MMSLGKIVLAALAGGFATVVAACSNDSKNGAKAKQGSEAACEHINDVCANTQGFQTQDCSSSNAAYEKLSASQKAATDAVIPCVMAAKSCEPALRCVSPKSNASTSSTNDDETARTHDTEDACEHINDVCADEPGFESQNCSSSNAGYENLSDSEKELADSLVPCIMKATSCKTAFQCLERLSNALSVDSPSW